MNDQIRQNNIDLIDRYIAGNLSPAEEELFHNKLNSDQEFADAYEMAQALTDMSREADLEARFKMLQEFESTLEEGPRKNSSRRLILLSLSAAAVLAIVLIFWPMGSSSNNAAQIAESNYLRHETVFSVKSANIERYALEIQADQAYDISDYRVAAELYAQANAEANDSDLYFYEGSSWLAAGEVDLAKQALGKTYAGLTDPILVLYRDYYETLILVAQGNFAQAEKRIDSLCSTDCLVREMRNLKSDLSRVNH